MTVHAEDGARAADGAATAARTAARVQRYISDRLDEILDDIREIVSWDSPSGDVRLLDDTAERLARRFAGVGEVSLLRPVPDGPSHLRVDIGIAPVARRTPLVLCHYDTVWPAGTPSRWPFEVANGMATGPGVLDMKASIAMTLHAIDALAACEIDLPAGVTVLISGDEEIGNPTSRALIGELAAEAGSALVLEPPLADGRLKTERKGHANVVVRVTGREAHAGVEPELGVDAAIEAARVAIEANELEDPRKGTTVNVGVIRAGTRPNVVAGEGRLELEVRARTDAELERVMTRLLELEPALEGASIEIDVDVDRPAMPRVPETDALLTLAKAAGDAIGVAVDEGPTGGVSEANYTQAAGTPTLDGLGAHGADAHNPGERIVVGSLVDRTALLAGLLAALSAAPAR